MPKWTEAGSHSLIPSNHSINKPEILFAKIEDPQIDAQIEKLKKTTQNTSKFPPMKDEITFDDFTKLDIRVGTITAAEKVKKADINSLEKGNYEKFSRSISEKALRFDLTVPFARYVSQNQNKISFPFKRYQIQPVWRADRPQHGRFQEFFQCDADIYGKKLKWFYCMMKYLEDLI